ncbi:phage tail protein [Anoxybacillus salavatliensis]|uniref:phage tail protein n=1 Tax=Anoxybacillus gonensis TaxID=198467 RepID=UPI00214BC563|nr:phage tail protein [Anoxybacillus gonensis]MCQ5366082.1 phage tail protein [Anoxybacillus gonensis]
MASNTPRLGLYKKDPIADANDTFNIQTMLNDNWDKIDGKVAILGPDGKILSEQLPQQSLPTASTTQAGIVKLNTSTNSTSTSEAATPSAVKEVNDALVAHSADYVKHITAAERAAWNSAEANAKAYTDSAPEAMQRNLGIFNVYKSGKDANGIFTIVEYKRANGTLFARSVLSDGTSPQYTTRTVTYYDTDGTTVLRTDTYTLTYDTDGDLISEVKQ